MNKLVSIIIPVFNAEDYIGRCVNSVGSQNYENLEIILVNDGSTDKSLEICEKMSINDRRIKVINCKNHGVSHARNTGLDNCNGDFITFIDSDDWVSKDYISTLLNYQEDSDYDIVISNATDVHDKCFVLESNNFEINKPLLLDRENSIVKFFKEDYFFPVCWGRLYKRNIIDSLRFDESMSVAEDGKFFLEAMERSKKNIVITEKNYFYFIRNGSLAHSGYDKKWLGELEFCNDCLKKYSNTKIENEVLYKFIEINVRLALMQNSETDGDINIFINNLKKYKKSFLKIKGHYKFKIKYLIALISPLRNTYKFIKFRKYSRGEE